METHPLHVECDNTLFRRADDFTTPEYQAALPATDIHHDTEVNAFVRATAPIPKYKIAGAHDDYGDATFDVRPGDILAVANGQVFDASQKADPLRRVGSLMVIDRPNEAGDHALRYDAGADKIRILLCAADPVRTVHHLTGSPAVPLDLFREPYVGRLRRAVPENLDRYAERKPWAAKATGPERTHSSSGLEPAVPVTLEPPDGDDLKDLENPLRLHAAFPTLTRRPARDLAKALNLRGGVTLLDALLPDEITNILAEELAAG